MLEAFERKIRQVRIRCGINVLIKQAGGVMIAAGIAGMLAVLIDRLFGVGLVNETLALYMGGISVAAALLLWIMNQPNQMEAALLIDDRLNLKERFSTALVVAGSDDVFARAAEKEARSKAEAVNVKSHFPIRATDRWFYAVGIWVISVGMFLFIPQQDLLGYLSRKKEQDNKTIQIEQAKKEIKEAAAPVKSVVKQLGNEELDSELAKLDPMMNKNMPQDAKRQTISES